MQKPSRSWPGDLIAGVVLGACSSSLWFAAATSGARCEELSCLAWFQVLYLGVPYVAMLFGGLLAALARVPHAWLIAVTGPVLAYTAGTATTMVLIAAPPFMVSTAVQHFFIVAAAGAGGYVVAALLVSDLLPRPLQVAGLVAGVLATAAAIWSGVMPWPGPRFAALPHGVGQSVSSINPFSAIARPSVLPPGGAGHMVRPF